MIKTIIVDDVLKSQALLAELLTSHCPEIQVVGQANSVDAACPLILTHQPDLILLDIEMPHKNGFELLKLFPNPTFEVIFTTAFDQYALRAIKFCALDYLLKPIDVEELKIAIQKIIQKHNKQHRNPNFSYFLENLKSSNTQDHKIGLPTLDGLIFIKVSDILRCEAAGSYTNVLLLHKKTIIATRKIKEFESLLGGHEFFRVHRSHLINLHYIEKYYKGSGGYVVMSDGSSIDVARRKKDDFLKQLSKI